MVPLRRCLCTAMASAGGCWPASFRAELVAAHRRVIMAGDTAIEVGKIMNYGRGAEGDEE